MRWEDGRPSGNVEDRRGGGVGRLGGGALIILIVVGVIYAFATHKDPSEILGQIAQMAGATEQGPVGTPKDAEGKFASVVLGSTEDVWKAKFAAMGRTYQDPTLVLYDQATFGGCGLGAEAMGPFYCPMDQKVYLDLQFFQELEQKFGAKGDFARAYVIAHEVGHHVQYLLGLTPRIEAAEKQAEALGGKAAANKVSVSTELQADCFAGVWAKAYAKTGKLQPGDIDSALSAAAAVGDDTIERKTAGDVVPDSFTHGTAAQRTHWFKVGYDTGEPKACDTFKASGQTLPQTGAEDQPPATSDGPTDPDQLSR
jgi:predicted metalloprotease